MIIQHDRDGYFCWHMQINFVTLLKFWCCFFYQRRGYPLTVCHPLGVERNATWKTSEESIACLTSVSDVKIVVSFLLASLLSTMLWLLFSFLLVARVKITKAALNEAEPFYLANFPRRRIYKRARTLKMIKKNQVIKARGNRLTCDCKVLEEGKRYLLFGREDRYNNVLYVDNFSIAFEIPKNDKRADSVVRDFQRERQTIHCPFSNLL